MEKGRVGREGANEGSTTLEGKGGDRKEERGEDEGEEICRSSVKLLSTPLTDLPFRIFY